VITWGLSTTSLGKSVSQERHPTREEIGMGCDRKFLVVNFVHGKKGRD
jgi:hypothetical protein